MDDEALPEELEEPCEEFHTSLLEMDKTLKTIQNVPLEALEEKLDKIDQAKMKLAMSFTLNSLYWAYKVVNGVSPKEGVVVGELARVKAAMDRMKKIEGTPTPDRRVDARAAKRFVRNALWEPKEEEEKKEEEEEEEEGDSEAKADEVKRDKKMRKRKRDSDARKKKMTTKKKKKT